MYRAVLAVVLAAALLAAAAPAIDHARRTATDATLADQLAALESAADRLAATDDPVAGVGARRVVPITVPAEGWGDAGVRRLTLRWRPDRGVVATWGRPGGTQRRTLAGPLRLARDAPLTFGPGRHEVVLRLVGTPADPVVTVGRVDGADGPVREPAGDRRSAPARSRPGLYQ
ncbi:DUF7311 family protein [Halomicrobium salinisoli]|uniref:DUF7311 family protein n=1 Tax=Halomicrobium salinisoli TaxID=2878391 RepID=UPI001CF04A2A|nr:ABC transporter [Halomicrobium salinisoli]